MAPTSDVSPPHALLLSLTRRPLFASCCPHEFRTPLEANSQPLLEREARTGAHVLIPKRFTHGVVGLHQQVIMTITIHVSDVQKANYSLRLFELGNRSAREKKGRSAR